MPCSFPIQASAAVDAAAADAAMITTEGYGADAYGSESYGDPNGGEFLNSCLCYHRICLLSILHIILFHGSFFSFFTNRWWWWLSPNEKRCVAEEEV